VKPSKILSVAPIFNSDPSSLSIEVLCSLCNEVDADSEAEPTGRQSLMAALPI
jgi:hypothetical protein